MRDSGRHYVEGPGAYSPADVAAAFGRALGRPVTVAVTPRAEWAATLRATGFSTQAAASFAAMTARTFDGTAQPAYPERGTTTLDQYIGQAVKGAQPR